MPTLFLHIGLHKTGTTAIQYSLWDARPQLRQAKIEYPDVGLDCNHHSLVTEWIALPAMFEGKECAQKVFADLCVAYPGDDWSLVVSSEEFCRNSPVFVDLEALRSYVSCFQKVKIVIVFRHQLELLQSTYLEIIRRSFFISFEEYLGFLQMELTADGVPLDFGKEIDRWAQVFGEENVIILDYGSLLRDRRSFTDAFLSAIFNEDKGLNLRDARVNVSSSPLAAWCSREVSGRPTDETPELIDVFEKVFRRLIPEGYRTCIFSRSEVSDLLPKFELLNDNLRKRLQRPASFLAAPNFLQGHMCRDEVGAPVWLEALRSARFGPVDGAPDRRERHHTTTWDSTASNNDRD